MTAIDLGEKKIELDMGEKPLRVVINASSGIAFFSGDRNNAGNGKRPLGSVDNPGNHRVCLWRMGILQHGC